MNMIWHDHVSPKRDIEVGHPAASVLLSSELSTIKRGDVFPVARRKCDEVEWLIDIKQIKSVRTILDHSPTVVAAYLGCNRA